MTSETPPNSPSVSAVIARAERVALLRRETPGAASLFAAWQLRAIGPRHPENLGETTDLYSRWHVEYHGPLAMAEALAAFQHAWCDGLLPDLDHYAAMTAEADRDALLEHIVVWLGFDAPCPELAPEQTAELEKDPTFQALLKLEDDWWDSREQ